MFHNCPPTIVLQRYIFFFLLQSNYGDFGSSHLAERDSTTGSFRRGAEKDDFAYGCCPTFVVRR